MGELRIMSRRFSSAQSSRQPRQSKPHSARRRRLSVETLESRNLLSANPVVTVDTNFGNFQIMLFPTAAPQTVANFLTYVQDGAYTDTIFHRSVPGFAEQTGGFLSPSNTFSGNTSQFTPITTNAAIPLEYGLANTPGTVAMARASSANSATSQWFVNLVDNSETLGPSNGGGYAVFGQVISGMSTLYTIAGLPVKNVDGGTFSQLPLANGSQLVRITSVTVDSINGTVFTDVNGNGTLDAGEPGLAGRTVFLNNDGSGVPNANNPSAVTDANGNYSFSGLAAGTYSVRELLPGNTSLTTPLQTVVVRAGQTASGTNFGERTAITGTVFADANSNGALDAGELGIAGRTVFLNIDGSGVPDVNNPSATTNANGVYYFTDLPPGSYSVSEVLPAGVNLSTPTTQTAVVQSGLTALSINFGEAPAPLTPDQKYIEQLYHDFLHRTVEPAGLQYWTNLMVGGATRLQVAQYMEGSPEYQNDTVIGLFTLYLHRAPDAATVAGLSKFLAAGGTGEQLAESLVSTSEYYQARGGATAQGYLNALFNDVLHRDIDAGSEAVLDKLDFSQTSVRLAIAAAVFGSNEYLQDLISLPGATNASSGYLTSGWYQAYLGRDADASLRASDANIMQNGMPHSAFLASIVASDEYFARAQSNF